MYVIDEDDIATFIFVEKLILCFYSKATNSVFLIISKVKNRQNQKMRKRRNKKKVEEILFCIIILSWITFLSFGSILCRDIPLPANDILRITRSFIFRKTYINFSYSLTKKLTYLVGFLLDFYWWLFVLNFLYFFLLFLLTGCNLKQHDLIKS